MNTEWKNTKMVTVQAGGLFLTLRSILLRRAENCKSGDLFLAQRKHYIKNLFTIMYLFLCVVILH